MDFTIHSAFTSQLCVAGSLNHLLSQITALTPNLLPTNCTYTYAFPQNQSPISAAGSQINTDITIPAVIPSDQRKSRDPQLLLKSWPQLRQLQSSVSSRLRRFSSDLKMKGMLDQNLLLRQIENDGYATREGVLSQDQVDELISSIEKERAGQALERNGKIFAVRNLLDSPEIKKLAQSESVLKLARIILGFGAFPVRGILFDKIPDANWKVPWHQDVTIAVREKAVVGGFGPWSTKAGILHVQPPASVLEKMISIRMHLDSCNESNGALQVIPGSHRSGRIAETSLLYSLDPSPTSVL